MESEQLHQPEARLVHTTALCEGKVRQKIMSADQLKEAEGCFAVGQLSGYFEWHVNATSLPIFHFGLLYVPTILSGTKCVVFKSQYVLTFPFAFLQVQGIRED